jgi:hypothetical protein
LHGPGVFRQARERGFCKRDESRLGERALA